MKHIFRFIGWIIAKFIKVIIFILEKLSWELALIAALLSLSATGIIHERIFGGTRKIGLALYAFGEAYYLNTNIDVFMKGFSTSVQNTIDSITANLEHDPHTALIAFIATFIAYKVAAFILKFMRNKVLKCKPICKTEDDKKQERPYEQLYRR